MTISLSLGEPVTKCWNQLVVPHCTMTVSPLLVLFVVQEIVVFLKHGMTIPVLAHVCHPSLELGLSTT